MEKDIGRPLTHLAHRLVAFDPFAAVRTVQQTNQPLEQEVRAEQSRWYLMRILPYTIGPNIYSGVVLTFVDITEARATQNHLIRSRQITQEISHHIPVGLFVYQVNETGEMLLENCNPEAERMTGITLEHWGGKDFADIWPRSEELGITDQFRQVIETGKACHLEDISYQDDRIPAHTASRPFPCRTDDWPSVSRISASSNGCTGNWRPVR
jgi:two-component system, chemotaxis family, CheB/CheR fusion protein